MMHSLKIRFVPDCWATKFSC